jgi:RHS repeat-associated protein
VSSYTTNASNELTATSNASYTYDSNGNTLTKTVGSNTTSYTWDFENRLSSVTLPGSGGTVSFKHDPYGRRIYKSSSAGTSAFAYDGANLIEETNSSGVAVARYAQASKIDEPLAMLRSSATSYYEADGLGSVTSLTNTSGALAQTYTVDSFGKQTASSGSLVNSFQYTGRELDPETGLYYYRARYYDPPSGRFLSEDPLRFGAGVDFYPYVGNSPLNFRDPLGLCPPDDPCWVPKYPPGQNPDTNIDWAVRGGPLFWFREQDWTGAPWDYKTTVGSQFDDAGNFNFGATGAALGFPDSMLLHGADLFKKYRNWKKGNPPNGNEPTKNIMIQRGIDYFKHGCSPPIELIEPPFLQ